MKTKHKFLRETPPHEVAEQIKNCQMSREIDEKGAGGFWDVAGNIAFMFDETLTDTEIEMLQENIYNALWEVTEAFLLKE